MTPLEWIRDNYNLLVVTAGAGLLGATSGAIGCFAVLRRRSLAGDALAHGALPGICLAYLVAGSRSTPALLLGALVSGVAGIGVIAALRRFTRIKEDAAIGIVLSVFYGAGIVLLSKTPSSMGLESWILGKTAGMSLNDVGWIGSLAGATLLVLLAVYKELKLVTFDADFASAQGWPSFLLDFLLMLLIAVAVVIGLPAVGVLMMAALLVIPAAAARFWTERLGWMVLLSSGIGVAAAVIGAQASNAYGVAAGPAIILTAGLLFFGSLLLAPRRGWLARAWRRRGQQREVQRRQFLALLYTQMAPSLPHVSALAISHLAQQGGPMAHTARLIRDAERRGELRREGSWLTLTPLGLNHAERAARNERLWQLYFDLYPEQAAAQLSLTLPEIQDVVPPLVLAELASRLNSTREDRP